jgi:arylsulfatase A-like enzyme
MKKPNILLIMTDQFRFDCMGCHGHPLVKTPALDGLARQGVDFQNAFAQSALCMPSRVSFFTGQYIHTHGIQSNGSKADMSRLTMLPNILQDQGYQTAMIGKGHAGPTRLIGFETARLCGGTHPGEANDYMRYLRENGYPPALNDDRSSRAYDAYTGDVPARHSLEAWTGDETLAFLAGRDTSRPFFLWTSFERPHPPAVVPPDNPFPYDPAAVTLPPRDESWYAGPDTKRAGCENMWNTFHTGDDALRQALANYYSLISLIDQQVGRILDALEKHGERENTIVVFTADHGDFGGEYGQFGKNVSTYDVLYRIPLLVAWPGHSGADRIYEPVESIDLMPTLLELAGLPVPKTVQGASFAAAVEGSGRRGGRAWDGKEAVFFETPFVKTVRTKTHKLSYCWKGTRNWGQLYDLAADPRETRNLYGDPAFAWVQHDLERRLLNWFIETQQPQVHGAGGAETAPPWRWYAEP